MRFLFGRKDSKNKETKENKDDSNRSYSKLGVFSPTIEDVQSNSLKEYRRLSELDSIFIRSKRLESLEDVPTIVNEVRDGNIMLLDISHLSDAGEQNHLELKRIVERIRGETRSFHADLALVNDGCVIVVPSFVKIQSIKS